MRGKYGLKTSRHTHTHEEMQEKFGMGIIFVSDGRGLIFGAVYTSFNSLTAVLTPIQEVNLHAD